MGMWLRRMVALGVLLVALAVLPTTAALAETTPPVSPTTSAVPSPSAEADDDQVDLPDVPLDDTRTMLALVGAGVLAVLAGVVVLVRR